MDRTGQDHPPGTPQERSYVFTSVSESISTEFVPFRNGTPQTTCRKLPWAPSSPHQMADNLGRKVILQEGCLLLHTYSILPFTLFCYPYLQMSFQFKSFILLTLRSKWMQFSDYLSWKYFIMPKLGRISFFSVTGQIETFCAWSHLLFFIQNPFRTIKLTSKKGLCVASVIMEKSSHIPFDSHEIVFLNLA